MAKSNRTNRVRRTSDSAEHQQDSVSTEASDLPVEELDADEAGLDAHDLPGVDSAEDQADSTPDSGKTFPEEAAPAAADADDDPADPADAADPAGPADADAASSKDAAVTAATPKKSTKAKADTASGSTAAAGRNRKAAGADSAKKSSKGSAKSGNPAKRASNRKTASYTSTPGTQTIKPNGRWFVPTMVTILLLGLAWLVVFYVSSGAFPVGAWGYWNLGVGFAILVVGLVMSTRWR